MQNLGPRRLNRALNRNLVDKGGAAGVFASAPLDLRFALQKTLDPRITFTRASSGTYVDSSGVLRSAVTNLKTFSDAILTTNSYNAVTSTLTTVTTATPTASTTASLFTLNAGANTGNNNDGLNFSSAITLTNSTSHTQSLFVKPVGATVLRLRDNALGGTYDFTLTGNGTAPAIAGALTGASIVALANGWYRVSWTFTTTTSAPGNRSDYWTIKTNVADGTNGLYVVGAQLEQASTVGDYIPTTSVINSAPRFDHNPTTGESLGLLVEEARTNSIRNNTGVGAVAGTPGTNPINWFAYASAGTGVSTSIIGTGTDNGVNYVDIRFNGTPSASAVWSVITESAGIIPAATGQTWTYSAWIKIASGSASNVSNPVFFFDETVGSTFVTGASISTSFLTSTLNRYLATHTLTGGATVNRVNAGIRFGVTSGQPIDITLRIGLPQLEQGAFATSVIPTTSATVTRAADVASITGANFGTTRTNLLLRSEEFNDAAWPRFGATLPTVTANAGVAPNGTTTADLWTRSITGSSFIAQAPAKAASAIQYTFSVFVKQSVGNFCALRCQGTFPNKVDVVFNISSGTIHTAATVAGGTFTGPSASITPYPDGWYRLTVTATSDTATFYQCNASFNSNGGVIDGTDSVSNSAGFLWGAQLETGSTATAYIPTTTAAVSVFESSFYNQTEGSFFCSTTAPKGTVIFGTGDTFDNTQYVTVGSSNNVTIRSSNADSAVLTAPVSTTGTTNIAFGYALNSFAAASNGGTISTDTSGAVPLAQVRLKLGSSAWAPNAGNDINGTIKRLTYWPTRLSNTTLQQITQP